MSSRKFVCVSILIAASSLFTAAQNVWNPEMQVKMRLPATPQISPDGTRVVYAVSDAVTTAEKSEFVSQIWLASTDGKENFQLTYSEKSSTNPKWSPDGTRIAFTSNRKDNKNNLYMLNAKGGEAEMLTDLKGSITDFEWSPDGKLIAYAIADLKTDEEEKNDKGKNDFRWVDENIKFSRLYVAPVEKDASGKREARKLTSENRHIGNFDWSPDGSRIIFSHSKSPVADVWPSLDIAVVTVSDGKVTPFAATEAAENSPMYSPDGKWVAASVSDTPVRWAQSNRIAIFPASGGEPRMMPMSLDAQPVVIGWSPDGSKLRFSEAKGTGTAIYELDAAKGAIKELKYSNAVISNSSMSKDGSTTAYVIQSATKPPEVAVIRVGDEKLTQISRVNSELANMPIGKTEVIRWKSTDGRDVEGLLTYPVGYVAGTKVPLILNIHGGPAGVFQQNFIGGRGVYPLATLAQRGFAILRPNPRGSSGYGTEFRRANIKDWGGRDYEDLMTGVDKVIEMGVADPDRMGVMGWSYGGFMTSTIITKTKRFKAASAGAPVTNLMSFNGTADIPSFVPDYFGGQAWENPEIYAKHSAVFNIKGASTPTLIQHGDADIRVPISQGYELYNALKAQGVPTRMIVLPRQPHGPNEPKMQIAAMQSNLDWFEKYLLGK
jgi:dipeptidyl aminopeptidase/acylaminoacyl peptidase